jgi:hypothetical protein
MVLRHGREPGGGAGVTGQPDQPTLPEPIDDVAQETTRTLPGQPPRPAEHVAVDHQPIHADLRHADLRHAELRNAELRRAELRPRDPAGDQLAARLWRLPPGHPSSPYDGEGRLRPPVPDWREFGQEPLPGEDRAETETGAADGRDRSAPNPPDSTEPPILENEQTDRPGPADLVIHSVQETDRSWLSAVPGLRELWQKHEQKWPESERPPADRSGDEPGSWRGGSGHFLNFEENLVSDHAKARVGKLEEKTTPLLLSIRSAVPGAEMAGLQFRLKGDDRFKEKVADELRAKPERVISTISENMPDAMRYTYQFEDGRYTTGYWDTHRRLVEQGYSLDFRRNSWESGQYKGLNTRWRTPEGQLFEIQFHTPESFAAKQLTHKAYERIRSPTTSDRERDDLYSFQAEVSSHVPLPANALTIPDYCKEQHEIDG